MAEVKQKLQNYQNHWPYTSIIYTLIWLHPVAGGT